MKKKIRRRLDTIWRIIGIVILILFIYDIYIPIRTETANNTLTFIAVGSMILYAIISAIFFLPPILTKFFKTFKRK